MFTIPVTPFNEDRSIDWAILHRRGVIASTAMRIPAARVLDRIDLEEIDIILDRLSPLLAWRKRAA